MVRGAGIRWVIRLPPGRGIAAGWQMMLPAESGTLPHRPWATMPLVNGRTRKRSAAGGWSEAEVCAEELAAPRKPLRWRALEQVCLFLYLAIYGLCILLEHYPVGEQALYCMALVGEHHSGCAYGERLSIVLRILC